MNKHLLFDKSRGIATITLNRPKDYNAFSTEMLKGWISALEEVRRDDDIKVLVLTGAGNAFCAGGDVKAVSRGEGFVDNISSLINTGTKILDLKKSLSDFIHRVAFILEDIDKPVIASINGPAMGAGLDMALMCDLRVAAAEAIFAESYIRLGLVSGDGGSYFLPRLIGLPRALELLWTGESIDAQEALKIGLVNKVVPLTNLREETMKLATKLAEKPPVAIRLIKRAVYQGLKSDLRTSLDLASSHMAIVTQTEDHREALKAFFEKKETVYKGR